MSLSRLRLSRLRLFRLSFSLVLALLLATLLPVPALANGDSWPSFRGDGTGQTTASLPNGALRFEKRWSREIGSGYAGIVVGGGLVVTAAEDGEHDFIVALDPETGDQRWRYNLAETYPGHDGSHDGPIATPAIADGRVFALGPWGHLAAVSLKDGKELWTHHLVDDLESAKPMYGFSGSPAVAGDVVVVQVGGDKGAVAGFDVASGKMLWRSLEDGIFSQSPVITEIDGQPQVLAIGVGKVAGLHPKNGEILWEHAHKGERGAMGAATSSPIPLDGNRLFIKHSELTTLVLGVEASDSGYEPAVLHEVRGLHKSYSPPALWGDQVYGYTGRFLSAIDTKSGEMLWRSRQPGDGFLVAVDGRLAVLTKTGTLHLGDASPDGWNETANLELFTEDLAWTPPSIVGNQIFARSLGEIARVDIVAGEAALLADAAMPKAIEELTASLAEAEDKAAAVRSFLRGKENPMVHGNEVTFLWRGEADDVAVAGDMIGMRREEAMHQIEGTDLWWWSTELDLRARISYLFLVNNEPVVDPSHLRRVQSTVLGPDMNWQRAEPLEMSWFAMPDWPGWHKDAHPHRGRMETVKAPIKNPSNDENAPALEATLHVWLPPGYDSSEARYPVVYVHQPRAKDDGRWPETLDRVVGRSVEPLIAIFVEGARMRDFGTAFVNEVVPFVDDRYRTRADRDSRANVGMGWVSGAALGISFAHSDVFGRIGVQSYYGLTSSIGGIQGQLGEATAADMPFRIYLEWGKWDLISPHEEMNMRASSAWLYDFLRERGWEPIGGEVADSTDFASWRNRADVLLEALFPMDSSATSPTGLERWLTGAP